MGLFRRLVIRLGATEPRFDIVFRVRPTPIAQAWAKMLAERAAQGPLSEFCYFSHSGNRLAEELDHKIARVRACADEIKRLSPKVNFGVMDFSNIQVELNRLQGDFLRARGIGLAEHPASNPLWQKYEAGLHQLAMVMEKRRELSATGVEQNEITLRFPQGAHEGLQPEDFKSGTLQRNFGTCYLGYSGAGLSIADLFDLRDRGVSLEKIEPFRQFSANAHFYFGPTEGLDHGVERAQRLKKWFYDEWGEIFRERGLKWDLFALGIPQIPVAHLDEPLFSIAEVLALQAKIRERPFLHSVQLE